MVDRASGDDELAWIACWSHVSLHAEKALQVPVFEAWKRQKHSNLVHVFPGMLCEHQASYVPSIDRSSFPNKHG